MFFVAEIRELSEKSKFGHVKGAIQISNAHNFTYEPQRGTSTDT